MRVFVVVGTRPEAIKMAPVYKALAATDGIDVALISTGQHREMLAQVFDWFGLKPDVDLALMRHDQTLSGVLSLALSALDDVITRDRPDVILAQGDTTTVLAAGLAAFHARIAFGHVEAGLRTYDLNAPFPEEANRALVGRISTYNFAPTERAAQALRDERAPGAIIVTGNTVVDALLDTAERVGEPQTPLSRPRLVLVTGHRRENHGARFDEAFSAMGELARMHDDVDFVYPVHLNPNVRDAALEALSGIDNFHLIEPAPYYELVALMKKASLILTDSGGIQEEAPTFRTPTLVLRDTTERPEALASGVCELVGVSKARIVARGAEILAGRGPDLSKAVNPYGDGKASARIVEYLMNAHGGDPHAQDGAPGETDQPKELSQ